MAGEEVHTMFCKMFSSLYRGTVKILDEPEYNPPEGFEHATPALVGNFPKSPADGDGQNVKVYEERMPASFFIIEVDDAPDSVGEPSVAFSLSTGSGAEAGQLAFAIARAVAEGMLSITQCPQE